MLIHLRIQVNVTGEIETMSAELETVPDLAARLLLPGRAVPIVAVQEDGPTWWRLAAGASPSDAGNWVDVTPVGVPGPAFIQEASDPTPSTGVDGDSHFNKASRAMRGPKTGGAWPAPAFLRQWYPALPGETGVLDETQPPGHNRRYGIIPDGVTNWETDHSPKVAAWMASWHLTGARGYAEPGFYKTALNIAGTGMNGSYCYMDYAEFAGVFHVLSSGTPVSGEAKIEDLAFPGTLILYDRLGPVNARNLKFGDVLLKNDVAKNLAGTENRGAHIYFGVDGLTMNDLIIYDTGNDPNMDAALAMDGATDNPKNCRFNRVWIKDTAVHGAYVTGSGHYFGELRVDAFGRTNFVGTSIDYMQDAASLSQCQELCGAWLNRTWDSEYRLIQISQVAATTPTAIRPNAVYDLRVSETDLSGPRPITIGRIVANNLGAGGSTGTASTSTGRGIAFGDRNNATGAKAVNAAVGTIEVQMADAVTLQTGYQAVQINTMPQPSAINQTGDTRMTNLGINPGVATQAGTTYSTSGKTIYGYSAALFARGTALDVRGFASMPAGVLYRFRGSTLDVPAIDWRATAGSILGPCDLNATASGANTKKAVNIDAASGTIGPISSQHFRSASGTIAVNASSSLTLLLGSVSSTIAAGFLGVRLTGTLTDVRIKGGNITGFDTGIAKGTVTLNRLSLDGTVSKGGGSPNNATGTNLVGGDYTAYGATDLS